MRTLKINLIEPEKSDLKYKKIVFPEKSKIWDKK